MDKLIVKKSLLMLMTLSFSVMLNWCDGVIYVLEQFEGVFADDPVEEVIPPLPDPGPEPELVDNVDLEGLTEAEYIVQMIDVMIAAEFIQQVQIDDERLENEPVTTYLDRNRNIYAEEIDGVIQEYTYWTETERIDLANPMAKYFRRQKEESEEDATYDERLLAAAAEMNNRFVERRREQEGFQLGTSNILLPGPSPDQIENAEIYGDVVRGDLTRGYLEESVVYRGRLIALDPDEIIHVKIEVNPHTGVITFSEYYEVLYPEESEPEQINRVSLQNKKYEISEPDREFPPLDDIGIIKENDARRILEEYDLMAFYEKF